MWDNSDRSPNMTGARGAERTPMAWRHPFITIDQNQLRHPAAISRALDDCCRDGVHLLLPDGAFLEFSKSGFPFETARRSLELLAPHRELVCSSRKITEMMRDELSQCAPCATLVQDSSTEYLRSLLAEIERGDESVLRKLVDGPVAELMPPALDVWNDHDQNRQMVIGLRDALKKEIPSDQLQVLRRSPERGVADWLSSASGTRLVFQGLKARGADDTTAYALTRSPSVSAGFLSALGGLAVYWLAFGGLESAAAKVSSRDLHDVEYVVLGAMSHSLATADKRTSFLCGAAARALESRRELPSA